eukprot:TRINITY_DN1375_c0_g1_i1.p1 TRINITY_DN1375_c0_g1~~TRINITY_DN1375_c0_g1_i1.p1  ORF type:complete len:335 (-),score=100.25 TRINITY_DN1375_c0_g1_i1:66-1070(-)
MSNNQQNDSSWWGWGNQILDVVKQKSEAVINIVQEDLQDFTKSIQDDTKTVLETQLKNVNTTTENQPTIGSITSGITNFFLGISSPETRDTQTKIDAKLLSSDPEDEDYPAWAATFDAKSKTEEISQILSSDEKLKDLHTTLVPTVLYSDFWKRYFYHLTKNQKIQEKRVALYDDDAENKDDWDEDLEKYILENIAEEIDEDEEGNEKFPQEPKKTPEATQEESKGVVVENKITDGIEREEAMTKEAKMAEKLIEQPKESEDPKEERAHEDDIIEPSSEKIEKSIEEQLPLTDNLDHGVEPIDIDEAVDGIDVGEGEIIELANLKTDDEWSSWE